MPRTEKTRQARIERTLMTVRAHPDGLTEAELADLLGLNRRTVNNYLRDLELQGQLYQEGILWFAVRSDSMRLRPLDLTPEEAATLYLATRLFVKQTDKRNEPAENALYKLAEALTADIGVGDEIRQAAQELAARQMDPGYSKVFGAVVRGYLYRRAVEIVYAPRKGRPFQTTVHPYLLEPSAIGYTTYIIGYSSQPDALRTYKLERVREAQLTGESYTIPPDFPGLEILRHSWSIMLGEELVEVVLRFHPSVVGRVNETRWHPSERKEADPDRFGWLRWTAQVTDTTDMLPWIRGWGADVEVLAPEELRIEMMGEARRIAERYGWETSKAEQSVSNADDLTATFRIYSGDE